MTVDPVPVIDLTDEELAALDGPPSGLVVSPWLETLEPAARDVAVLTAFRSLVARELVVAPTEEQAAAAARSSGDGDVVPVEVQMVEEISQVLTLRRSATAVVCVQRTTDARRTWRYLHALGPELCLDEVVEPTGLHRFSLVRREDAPDLLLEWLAPDGAQGSDGPEVALDAQQAADGRADAAVLDRLGEAHVLGDVTVRRADDGGPGRLLGTFAGPDGLHLSTTEFGSGAQVRLRPVSRRTLRTALADELEVTV